jgi:hypothetical protein
MNLGRYMAIRYHLKGPGDLGVVRAISGADQPRPFKNGRGWTMRISDFCFIVAGLSALTGMGLGIRMGILQDFTLSPAHAHLNLLGWVTMALYGLYHRGTGRTRGAMGWTQVVCGAIGAVAMSGGLAAYLATGNDDVVPVVVVGSLVSLLSMILFMVILIADLRRGEHLSPEAKEARA